MKRAANDRSLITQWNHAQPLRRVVRRSLGRAVAAMFVLSLLAGAGGCSGLSTSISGRLWPLHSEARGKGSLRNLPRSAKAKARAAASVDPGVAMVEKSLRGQGIQFGTDGSVGALYSYATGSHQKIPASSARAGDIVFFDTATRGGPCGSHVGLVDAVTAAGALSFREYRDGKSQRSLVDAARPTTRRDESGQVVNSFLRPKRLGDAPGTRYYAGEMLCTVVRVRGPE